MTLSKDTRIAIIGLGYVDLPLAVELEKKYPTLGFDTNQRRVDELRDGVINSETSVPENRPFMFNKLLPVAPGILSAPKNNPSEGIMQSNQSTFGKSSRKTKIHKRTKNTDMPPEVLTPRETAVLELMARGDTYAEIGQILSITVNTVETHVKNMFKKMSVHSRGEAVFEAFQNDLLPHLVVKAERDSQLNEHTNTSIKCQIPICTAASAIGPK